MITVDLKIKRTLQPNDDYILPSYFCKILEYLTQGHKHSGQLARVLWVGAIVTHCHSRITLILAPRSFRYRNSGVELSHRPSTLVSRDPSR